MTVQYLGDHSKINSVLKNLDTLLIDFDGTLVDYHYSENTSLIKLFNERNVKSSKIPEIIETYIKINLKMWKAFEKDEIGMDEVKVNRFQELSNYYSLNLEPVEFNTKYQALFAENVKAYEGSIEALARLYNESEYKLVVVTNGTDPIQKRRCKITGVDKFVHGIFSSDGVGYSKPSPEIFVTSMDHVGATNSTSMMVGDSLSSDITGAYNLGIISCLIDGDGTYDGREPKPDLITASFVDFVNWILEI